MKRKSQRSSTFSEIFLYGNSDGLVANKYIVPKKYLNYEKDNNRIPIKADSQGVD